MVDAPPDHCSRLRILSSALGRFRVQLLVTLDVNSNEIKELVPDVRQLRTLEVLDVSSNRIATLAKNLDYLYTLRRLNVANNQYLTRRPIRVRVVAGTQLVKYQYP